MLDANLPNLFNGYSQAYGGIDLNGLSVSSSLRPDTQQLCRTLLQNFGSLSSDPNSVVTQQLLTAMADTKRNTPPPQPSVSVQEMTETNECPLLLESGAMPLTGELTNPANFSLTAALIGAMTANSASIGSQLLPACNQLLNLAVRQALGACLPNCVQLNIQGNLRVAVAAGQNGEHSSSTVLTFNDHLPERRWSLTEASQRFSVADSASVEAASVATPVLTSEATPGWPNSVNSSNSTGRMHEVRRPRSNRRFPCN